MIAPSLLSADFSKLGQEVSELESLGCRWFHVDVMDGHFVPNLTIGPIVVEWLRKRTQSILDCHLMVEKPEKMVPWFLDAGADVVTIHFEATPQPKPILELIRQSKKKAGISIKPGTAVESIEPLLGLVDLVLVMSVEPGFGGQKFMPEMLKKVEWLKRVRQARGLSFQIEIDGGIGPSTITAAAQAGVDLFVAGSAVFGAKDRALAFRNLSELVDQARGGVKSC